MSVSLFTVRVQGAAQLVGSSFVSVKIGRCSPDGGLVSFVKQKITNRSQWVCVSHASYNSCAVLVGVY